MYENRWMYNRKGRNNRMVKYIHILAGAILISWGSGYVDAYFTFYIAGTLFCTAGIGEILLGE